MDKIQFNSVIPKVFSQLPSLESEVWNTDITFEKGHLYLIEADSGKGKSTFCSYIVTIIADRFCLTHRILKALRLANG